jgi:hypothetical protein
LGSQDCWPTAWPKASPFKSGCASIHRSVSTTCSGNVDAARICATSESGYSAIGATNCCNCSGVCCGMAARRGPARGLAGLGKPAGSAAKLRTIKPKTAGKPKPVYPSAALGAQRYGPKCSLFGELRQQLRYRMVSCRQILFGPVSLIQALAMPHLKRAGRRPCCLAGCDRRELIN